jgi:hypothetical protein
MRKLTVNHITIQPKGKNGPWGYALVNSDDPNFAAADSIELRGLGLETFTKLAKALPTVKAADKILTVEADIRYEKRVENFVTKEGEPATKNVVRIYLTSTPTWKQEVRPVVGEGNLDDIIGDILDDDDDDLFS